jgi:hypothetical protein
MEETHEEERGIEVLYPRYLYNEWDERREMDAPLLCS